MSPKMFNVAEVLMWRYPVTMQQGFLAVDANVLTRRMQDSFQRFHLNSQSYKEHSYCVLIKVYEDVEAKATSQ